MNFGRLPQQNVEGQAQEAREAPPPVPAVGGFGRPVFPLPIIPPAFVFNPFDPRIADQKCEICLDDGSARRLITCPENHSVHPECFIEYVDVTLGTGYYLQREHLDTTKCVHHGCEHKWNNEFIITFPSVTVTTVQTMIAGRTSFGKGIIMSAIMNHCTRCPHCGTEFGGFDACNAVRCATCNRHFCAICMEACLGDAHEHVMGHGGLFDYNLPADFRMQKNKEVRTGIAIRLLSLLCDRRLLYEIYGALCSSYTDQLLMDQIRAEVDCEEPPESESESESKSGSNWSSQVDHGPVDWPLSESSSESSNESSERINELENGDLESDSDASMLRDLQELENGDLESDSDASSFTDMELSSLEELYLPESPDYDRKEGDLEVEDGEDGMAIDENDDVSDASSNGLEGWKEETVISQMTQEQNRTDFCLDRDQFKHLCAEIGESFSHSRFTRRAVDALQTASEELLTSILSSAHRCARNRQRELAKVRPEDIELAIRVARDDLGVVNHWRVV